jgi:hypothetical protein
MNRETLCPDGQEPKRQLCADCPMGVRDEWRKRASLLRLELLRHDLDLREFKIANLILDKTFGWQRDEVVFPQLRFFTDFTGIQPSDVVKVLKSLHARRLISITTKKGQPHYAINPDPDRWKALPRTTTETIQATNNLMREINGLEPLPIEMEAQLNFKIRPFPKKTGAKTGDLPMCEPQCLQTGEFPNLM